MTVGSPVFELIARALLGALVVVGSFFLWIGVPVGGLWLAGELFTTAEAFLFAALGGIPLAMAAVGFLLYRVNALYESAGGDERRLIDVAMTASAVAALVLLTVWFFFAAEYRLVTPL